MIQYHFSGRGKLRNVNGIQFLLGTVCRNDDGIQLDDNVNDDGMIRLFESMSVPSCFIYSNNLLNQRI